MSETKELAPRFVVTQYGSYGMVEWTGRNESGIRAWHNKVLVLPDQAAGMVGSIIIPEAIKDTIGAAATTGIIVSVGDGAFRYGTDGNQWVGERPTPGDRVYFQKYAGQEHEGRDGLLYRIMEDRSIAGGEELLQEAAD
jgi:chaperonin GroES